MRGNTLERSVKNLFGGDENVLLARNLTLKSAAAINKIYMFGPHRGPLPHLWNITVKHHYENKPV